MKTKVISILLSTCLFGSIAGYCAEGNGLTADEAYKRIDHAVALKLGASNAYVNGEMRRIDPANRNVIPMLRNDRTLVPIRFVAEAFGADVSWADDIATIRYGGKTAIVPTNIPSMTVDGRQIPLDSPAINENDRMFLPLRRLCEDLLGKQVFYANGLILISDSANLVSENDNSVINHLLALFKDDTKLPYMIDYGHLDDTVIETAKHYKIVIVNPKTGDVTREQVQCIRQGINPDDPSDDVIVLGYISIGEDLRTAWLSPEQMMSDPRFTGDRSGPRVDPRTAGTTDLKGITPKGNSSPGGGGYASYYLDDNNNDGKPDFNANFHCAFVNVGDPAWFDVLNGMTMDGADKMPGMTEILSDDYGRSLGCDGLFLDTVDTCAPNSFTDDSSPNKSHFEWTAPGYYSFAERLKQVHPDKYILQNRGLFFYDPRLPHYAYNPGELIDFLLFESYMLDSNVAAPYNESFFADNKNAYMPKIVAEAGRPNGFRILSLGYAEGPPVLQLKETLLGQSQTGLPILLEDIRQTQKIAGFSHYITDGPVTLVNDFVRTHSEGSDFQAPVWSSVYNDSTVWPPHEPTPRVGVREAIGIGGGALLRWDVALDENNVSYELYYQKIPFNFSSDPSLSQASHMTLLAGVGDGYAENHGGAMVYPYQARVQGLDRGATYYFVIRARDDSPNRNEERNMVVLSTKLI